MNKDKEMPAALFITRNLPPLIGGMERLAWHIVDELMQKYRIGVIGPEGCREHLPFSVDCVEVPLAPLFKFIGASQLAAIRLAFRVKPKIVLAGSGLTAPMAWLIGRIFNARCYAYLHGLDIEANHALYRMLWRPFFRRFDVVLVNSRFTKKLAAKAGVADTRIHVLNPGVTLPDISNAKKKRTAFRQRYHLGNRPLMLYVGRITARKGFSVFVKDILPKIIERVPDARLLVIGDEPKYALQHRTGEKRRAMDVLADNKLNDVVRFIPGADDTELTVAYFASDSLVFPVQELPHDHEGFGMVALEAAAHGLATVAFASGGVTDAVADGVSGILVPVGDYESFAQAVIHQLEKKSSLSVDGITKFASEFAWPLFGKKLRHLC